MENLRELSRAYRLFLIELGQEFQRVRDERLYEGFADTFIDAIKSPEIGFTNAEATAYMAISKSFGLLSPDDLPSHHAMKLMVNKKVDMDLLDSAKTLSLTDFKELIKDDELGTQERTYKYEIIKRAVESGSIKKVYGEELKEAIKQLQDDV